MAYITLAGKRDTDAAEAVNKMLLSDDDYNRVAYWSAKTFFPKGVHVPGTPEVPAVLDADGNEVTPAVPAVPDSYRQPTGEELFKAVTDYVYADIRQKAFQLELREKQEAAAATVVPIELTPAE